MIRELRIAAACAALLLLVATPRAEANGRLADAQQLYASAAYTDALAMLDGLLVMQPSPQERLSIELYRTLCFVALGRTKEAQRSIEAILEEDPLYRPSSADVPPRVQAAITDVRRRMLPSLVQQAYSEAKSAYDRQDFEEAAAGFDRTLDALADPDIAQAASKPPLADLQVLAEGFRDLSLKASEPLPAAAPAAAAPAPAVTSNRIYAAEDPEVVAPVVIRQHIPPYRGKMNPGNGVVEVVIDATGRVENARMVLPLHGPFDHIVLSAAKRWEYEPATLNGVPVRFRKMVRVSLVPNP